MVGRCSTRAARLANGHMPCSTTLGPQLPQGGHLPFDEDTGEFLGPDQFWQLPLQVLGDTATGETRLAGNDREASCFDHGFETAATREETDP